MIRHYAGISCKTKKNGRNSIRKPYSILVIYLIFKFGGVGLIDASFAQVNGPAGDEEAVCKTIEIFPLVSKHVHGSTIVELPNGDLMAAWFQGSGEIGGELWIYDYHGFLAPSWPNGIDERPAIIGTIVRTIPHSNGQAKAGYVASWIAVKQ